MFLVMKFRKETELIFFSQAFSLSPMKAEKKSETRKCNLLFRCL